MNIQQYKERRECLRDGTCYRTLCQRCLQPDQSCYCHLIQSLDVKIRFVILIHPIEARRRIATGRMSHLCLRNSDLLMGQNFSGHPKIQEILENEGVYPVLLYPGENAINLTQLSESEKRDLFPVTKELVVFVLDGTWTTAKKMIRQSQNLKLLPRICFTPPTPSNFRVRKQPRVECYSTLEAIHHTIELMGSSRGYDLKKREHDQLLRVFNQMVEKQILARGGAMNYRKVLNTR